MKKKPKKAVKRKHKAKPFGGPMLFNGNAYIVQTVDTLYNDRFEQVTLTVVRYLPLS
jgi:hypothetical protein